MMPNIKRAVIISPHPDDETLGVGGTIKKLTSNKIEVSILVVSGHTPPLYSKKSYEKTVIESKKVFKYLGVKKYKFLNIPATQVRELATIDLNKKISDFLSKINPDTVFIPFPDRHIDHRVIFDSCVVACRPISKKFPQNVFIYETLSETHWNVPAVEAVFQPTVFFNIDKQLVAKKRALGMYKTQINSSTPSRSVDASEALARFRGSQNGCKYAEAFQVLRIIV